MGRRIRSVMMIAAFLFCLGAGTVLAQDKPADNMDIVREKARTDKKLVVATALNLTEGEAKAFWPVYNSYQSDMIAHYDRVFKFVDAYAKSYESMSDENATQLLGEFLSLETDYIALLNSYVPRFRRVLPPVKVARLYQVENKMRALVDYEFARTIPLIK
jgi:hypothetical protein